MKYYTKVTLWVIFLIIIAGLSSWWMYGREASRESVEKSSIKKVVFSCSAQKSIRAGFHDQSVNLQLSDGRHMVLKRAISASGARYANDDESIVFWNKGNTAFITEDDSTTYKHCVVKGQDDLTNLKMYEGKTIRFRYPRVLHKYRESVSDTSGWSYAGIKKGEVLIQLKLDSLTQPKTNLSGATFTVGKSQNPDALKKCMEKPQSAAIKADSIQKGGINFMRSQYSDAGAGNYYQVKQFRTLYKNSCYSVEEMVHSTNIHNYPASRGITVFDSARVWKALNVAWQTFSFVK